MTDDLLEFETRLKAIAYANRLQLLTLLRSPRTLDEIHLSPASAKAGGNPARTISRQAVQDHLDRLVETGLLRVRKRSREGRRSVQEFVVDRSRLFALAEDLRSLCVFEPTGRFDPCATEGLAASPAAADLAEPGPKVVVVHGADVGRSFALPRKGLANGRGWIVGRSDRSHVTLPYDPYVSSENAEILETTDGFRILDLRTSKNGTYVNWTRLPVGGEVSLGSGDVIGVGRSLLVFREE